MYSSSDHVVTIFEGVKSFFSLTFCFLSTPWS